MNSGFSALFSVGLLSTTLFFAAASADIVVGDVSVGCAKDPACINRLHPDIPAVANADPAEKATLLSQSISIAMNTTAFGLMVAIPLLLVHSMLQSKTAAIVESLEIAVVKFLNLMDGDTAPQAGAQKAAAPAKA